MWILTSPALLKKLESSSRAYETAHTRDEDERGGRGSGRHVGESLSLNEEAGGAGGAGGEL